MSWPWSLQWVKEYSRRDLAADLPAGLTIGVMLIPQGMAYAMLAGVEPIQGLYAAMIALFIYALLGTSRQLMVGPVAMDSLLVMAVVTGLAVERSEQYLALAMVLALMVGTIQVIMGLARMGFLVNFLSRPVLKGFTTGAPIIIAISQVKHLLGYDVASSQQVVVVVHDMLPKLGQTHLPTLAIGLGSIAVLILTKRFLPKVPGPLLVVLLSVPLVWWLNRIGFGDGIRIVGNVPQGLPSFDLPAFRWELVGQLWLGAVAIAIIGYMEGISLAKVYAEKYRQRLGDNQEMVALGLSNIGVSFFQGFPIGGSFSRTAVIEQAGVRTPLAGWFAALVLMLTLLLLTGLFHYLPKAVLAAVVIMAVQSLVRFGELRDLWRIKKSDGVLFLVTFLATLIFGALVGLAAGLVASTVPIFLRLARPHVAELGVMPDGLDYRNLSRYPQARRVPGILLLRVDASFCFLNAAYLRKTIFNAFLNRDVHSIVIDASSMNDLDGTAYSVLERIHEALAEKNMRFYITGLKGPVRDILQAGGLWEEMGQESFQLSPAKAVNHLQRNTDLLAECKDGAGI